MLKSHTIPSNLELVIFPTFIHLQDCFNSLKENKDIKVYPQNISQTSFGAYTGEVPATQIKDLGLEGCLIGHSERRQLFSESDETIKLKIKQAVDNELTPIICVGESLEVRESNNHLQFVKAQINSVSEVLKSLNVPKFVIAYEPIWAIGTGKVANISQIEEMHSEIKSLILSNNIVKGEDNFKIIYGGSVNSKNCKEILSVQGVDGFLVGGASLKEEFLDIINSVN